MATGVWLVTGASKGMGLEIVRAALAAGHTVVGTSRSPERLRAQVEAGADRFRAVAMDLGSAESAQATVDAVVAEFGRLDVVVNNAGYSLLGAVEEFSDAEVAANFEVSVFGLLRVTRAALGAMRRQRSGMIVNMASISATVTSPATGLYSATKAAVLMLTEAVAQEAAEFGVRATAVCPGGVRTDFLDASSSRRPADTIEDYTQVSRALAQLDGLNHAQGGDPALVARAIVELADLPNPPSRLYLGRDALHAVREQSARVLASADEHRELSESTTRPA